MIVEELIATLGFEFDDKDLDKFNKGMGSAKKLLATVGVAAVASAGAIFAFTKSIAETNDEIGKNAQILGMAAAELQSWQFAAELGGSSANAMTTSLENLSRRASEASRGMGSGVEIFGMLGISATEANGQIKESSMLLEEVADRISTLDSQAQKLEFLEKLGISSDLLLTLDQGSEALKRQRLEAEQLGFTLSETATKDAAQFNDELLRTNKIISGVSNAIGQDLMKEITPMLTAFKEWFIANKKLIQQNIKGFLDNVMKAIKAVWTVTKRLFNTINTLANAFGGWEKSIIAVGTALLLMNAKALLIPLVFIAIGVAIALLTEDMVAYFNGAESAIGDLVDKFPLLGDVLESLRQILQMSANGWSLMLTDGKNALEGLVIIAKNLGKAITDFIMTPINEVKKAIEDLSNFSVGNPFSKGGSLDFLNPMQNYTPLQSQAITSNNQTVSSPMTFNAEINVTGGGDGASTATSIRKELDSWFSDVNKQATKNLKSGVVR